MEKAIKRYWPVFVLPTLIAFIIGFVWPFIWGTGLSFCKFTTVKNVQFAGLSNYKMIFMDDTFKMCIRDRHTGWYDLSEQKRPCRRRCNQYLQGFEWCSV